MQNNKNKRNCSESPGSSCLPPRGPGLSLLQGETFCLDCKFLPDLYLFPYSVGLSTLTAHLPASLPRPLSLRGCWELQAFLLQGLPEPLSPPHKAWSHQLSKSYTRARPAHVCHLRLHKRNCLCLFTFPRDSPSTSPGTVAGKSGDLLVGQVAQLWCFHSVPRLTDVR